MTKSLNNSLRCLSHPITLLSVALLIVNDHVLKYAVPTWLTGKLSDFAGLFFFPFLLTTFLGAVFDRFGFSIRKIGLAAFGLTSIWFILIKTSPWGNALAEKFLSNFFGFQVQIVLDPTDLLALIVLLPGWLLWKREEKTQPNRLAWVALSVATLASVATSPLPPTPRVVRVAEIDGTVYVGLGVQNYSKQIWPREQIISAAEGWDGTTWKETTKIPPALAHEINYPLTLCNPNNPLVCYRISVPEQIEQSKDEGKTWQTTWSVPWGRRYFMDRYNCMGIGCKKSGGIDMGPYDMTFLNRNGVNTLFVAMGSEGILVRSVDGDWDRRSVLKLEPTPFAVSNPLEGLWLLFFWEVVLLVPISLVLFLILNFLGLESFWKNTRERSGSQHSNWWAPRPMLIPVIVVFILVSTVVCLGLGLPGIGFYRNELATFLNVFVTLQLYIILFLIFILTPLGILLSWWRIASLANNRRLVWKSAGWTALASIACFPSLLGSLILWTMGIIPLYELALGIGVVTTVTLWITAFRKIHEASLNVMPSAPGIDSQQKLKVI